MRKHERIRGLIRSPLLAWEILGRGDYHFVYDQMPITIRNMSLEKRFNLVKSGMNLIHRRLTPWSMPLHMQFELTNFCNLKCPVCPTGLRAVSRKKLAMSVSHFKQILDEVGPYLLTASLWGWGESLLHPDLGAMLAETKKHPFVSFLSTNGQNLDDERVIQAIIDHPPTYLIVALDGLTDETNSKFRVGARLAPALEGVRRISEWKKKSGSVLPILHMRFIAMKHNEHEVPELVRFADDHHFDFLTVRTLSMIHTDASNDTYQSFIPETTRLSAYQYNEGRRISKQDFYCLEPFWLPTLFADGTLVNCIHDYNAELSLGKLSVSNSFRELWFGERSRTHRRKIRDHSMDLYFCRMCPARDRNTTDASIRAYYLNKQIDYANLGPS